jgi:N-terminal domain of toast_rack, DUF2154/Domain of unknown function (DUF5668)
MNDVRRPRRAGSITGALILIAIGVAFLISNLRPGIDAWGIIFRYWPLILIFIGVGKIFDSLIFRDNSSPPTHVSGVSGASVAVLALIIIFGIAVWRGHKRNDNVHDMHSVELLGAKTVSADVQMPAGQLRLTGGDTRLLDSDFDYREEEGKPSVEYNVSGDRGQLDISQEKNHLHWVGTTHNDWNLHFGGAEPLDLTLNMGAGHSDIDLRELNVNRLEVHIGAGEMNLDLGGPRKSNLTADIQGGVGSAIIRLPKDVGVRVHASGGIGSVSTDGLTRSGDDYVNAAYGKTPASIELTVQGGIGEIVLSEQ